ncbi:MAG TPA: hypothetical protein VLU54_04755 [Casimicrobiaceae bacterium]|nr:hypothetical protein [Casimicrobiaceae bacterium]
MNESANIDGADRGATPGDWLDRALAERSRDHSDLYILDEGFTSRVMSALPAPARPVPWRKPVLGALWTAAAVGFAVTLPGTTVDVAREAIRLVSAKPFSLSDVALLLAVAGAGMWTTAWFTWRRV